MLSLLFPRNPIGTVAALIFVLTIEVGLVESYSGVISRYVHSWVCIQAILAFTEPPPEYQY